MTTDCCPDCGGRLLNVMPSSDPLPYWGRNCPSCPTSVVWSFFTLGSDVTCCCNRWSAVPERSAQGISSPISSMQCSTLGLAFGAAGHLRLSHIEHQVWSFGQPPSHHSLGHRNPQPKLTSMRTDHVTLKSQLPSKPIPKGPGNVLDIIQCPRIERDLGLEDG